MDTSTEMMAEQMLHMDGATLQNMCRASRKHADICRSDTFWRRKFKYDFGDSIFNKVSAGNPISWKTEWINRTYGEVLYLYPAAQLFLYAANGNLFDYDEHLDEEFEEAMDENEIADALGIDSSYQVKLPLPLTDKAMHYYMVTIEKVVERFLKENVDIFKSSYEVSFDGEKFKVIVYPKIDSFNYMEDKINDLSEHIRQTSLNGDVDIDEILRNTYPKEFLSDFDPVITISKFYDTRGDELSKRDFYDLPHHDGGDGTYRQLGVKMPLFLDLIEDIELMETDKTLYGYDILD